MTLNAQIALVKFCMLSFIICLSSCSSQSQIDDSLLRIDFSKFDSRKHLLASEVVSEIEYVTLETSSNCLIGEAFTFFISENYILTFSNSNCFLFSREGKFIRSIGQKGNGPSDYGGGSNYRVMIDEKSEMVYLILNFFEIVAYRITGEFVKKLTVNELSDKIKVNHRYISFDFWKDNLFCAHINLSGKEQYRFCIFTLEGEIIKLFPNNIFFDADRLRQIFLGGVYFSNEHIFFKQGYSDTIFRLSDTFELVPAIVFDLPGKKIPENVRYQIRYDEFCYIQGISVFENYLFLKNSNNSYDYLYDLKNNRLIAFESDPLLRKVLPLPDGTLREFSLRGLKNDIDGGLPLLPAYASHIQNNQQMVCVYQSYLLKEQLTEDHFARCDIKDREAHKRLQSLLANLDEEDNPVIMIATLK